MVPYRVFGFGDFGNGDLFDELCAGGVEGGWGFVGGDFTSVVFFFFFGYFFFFLTFLNRIATACHILFPVSPSPGFFFFFFHFHLKIFSL